MRTIWGHSTVLCIVAGFTAACAPSGPTPFPTADAEAISAASQAYALAANDTAWSTWATFFTEDAAFLPPNTPTQRGRAAIEAWGRSFPPFRDLRLSPVEIVGRDDLAYVWGRYSLVIAPPNAVAMPDSGKYIEIWRKQSDGSWKVFRDTYNSDIPLAPAATPARQARR